MTKIHNCVPPDHVRVKDSVVETMCAFHISKPAMASQIVLMEVTKSQKCVLPLVNVIRRNLSVKIINAFLKSSIATILTIVEV